MTPLWVPRIYRSDGFSKENVLRGAAALDVGCGERKLPGSIGMDMLSLPGVDIVHDFNVHPWPFDDHRFDLVLMNHALEHGEDVVGIMSEIHRVLKPGGRLVIQVPYFRSTDAFSDPTHTHFFTSRSMDYFVTGRELSAYQYSKQLFLQKGFWYGWPTPSRNPFVRSFKSLITSQSGFYDQYLSLIAPVKCLTWELETVKQHGLYIAYQRR